jgi:hypothetical protein
MKGAQSGEQLGTGRRELHIGSGLVQQQPAQRDRSRKCGSVLLRCAAFFEKGNVDQLDIDAAILYRLARVGDLHQLAGGSVRVDEVVRRYEFHGHAIAIAEELEKLNRGMHFRYEAAA